jgi:archaellum component FlaC
MKNLLRKWLGITELTQSMLSFKVDADKSSDELKDDIMNDLEYEIERKVENEVEDHISNYSDKFDDIDSLRYDLDELKDTFENEDLSGGIDEAYSRIEGLTNRIEALEESVSSLSVLDRLEALEAKLK